MTWNQIQVTVRRLVGNKRLTVFTFKLVLVGNSLKVKLYWTSGNDVNIFQNGFFQDSRQRDNEQIKNILSLLAKSIEKPRFRENGHETLKYDPTKWKLN